MYGPASSKVTLVICRRNLALVSSCDTDILSLLLITCLPMAWIALVSAFSQPIWKNILIKIGFKKKRNCGWVHKDSECPYGEIEDFKRNERLGKTKWVTWGQKWVKSQIAFKHQLASDEGENLKRIVMLSFWKKNTLYLIFKDYNTFLKKSHLFIFMQFFKHFQSNSKELIWHNFFFNLMHGLKSATLSNFSERAGMAVPC